MSAVGDALRAWATKIAGPGSTPYANALVAAELTNLAARRVTTTALDAQITAKTTQRDAIKTQRQTVQGQVAALLGQLYSFDGTVTNGSTVVTGDFTGLAAVANGWVQSPNTHFKPGTTIAGWTTTTLTLDQAAKASGTIAIGVRTGSLAQQDATIARLTAQTLALQATLDAAETEAEITATITDGRAALVAAGHYLAPATVPSGLTGTDPATLTDATATLQTHLQTTVGNGTSGTPKWAHLWRGRVYRLDGTLTVTSKNWWRFDGHGSPLVATSAGGANRVHLSMVTCTNWMVTRVAIRGSLPIVGAAPPPPAPGLPPPLPPPQFNATYAGQHGIQVLGGSAGIIDRPDVTDVCGSGVRFAASGGDPDLMTVQGVGVVDRCGNHALAVAACDHLEWSTVWMGYTGRDTVAISPASGVVCDTVNVHNVHLVGGVTDPSYFSISVRSAGKVTGLTLDHITGDASHGPLQADIAATTSGQPHTDVVITNNVGSGRLLNTARAAWNLSGISNLTFRRNTQDMDVPQGRADPVMYGLKGTNVAGTIDVGANDVSPALAEALIDGVLYPPPAAALSITTTSLGPFTVGVSVPGGVQFATTGGTAPITWTHSIPVNGQALPSGITFSPGGLLTVNPGVGTAGSYTHRFTATDASSPAKVAQVDITFTVAASVATLAITTVGPFNFTKGTDDTVQLAATGGTPPYHWSLNSGTLPTGFTLTDDADNLHGDLTVDGATVGVTAGTSRTFKVTDSAGSPHTDTQPINLVVDPQPSAGAWPPQDVSEGWGYTLNPSPDYGWEELADRLWAALDGHKHGVADDPTNPNSPVWIGASSGGRGTWGWSRMQVSMDQVQPNPGDAYKFGYLPQMVAWCLARKIRPIVLLTFSPWWASNHPTFQGVTVSFNTDSRFPNQWVIQSPDFAGSGIWLDTHVISYGSGSGHIPEGWFVEKMAGFENVPGPYNGVFMLKKSGASVSNPTPGTCDIVFGGTPAWHGGAGDTHLGLAHGNGTVAYRGEGLVNGHLVAARIAGTIAKNYGTGDPDTELVFEIWNEAGGQHGYRPRYDPPRYATTVRYIYRAAKEVRPTIMVVTTGVTNNPTNNVNLRGPDYLDKLWDHMLADPPGPDGANDTWAKWIAGDTFLFTSGPEKGVVKLKTLKAAGSIDDTFWHDYWGWHMYGFGRGGPQNAYFTWVTNTSVASQYMTFLNLKFDKDPTAGKVGLNRMKLMCTEMGCPSHQLAQTNKGITALMLDASGKTPLDPLAVDATASMSEAYVHVAVNRLILYGKLKFPRHTATNGIPVNRSGIEPEDNIAVLNYQRLVQVSNLYLGGGTFTFQGIFTQTAAPGPPLIPAGTMKRIGGTRTDLYPDNKIQGVDIGTGNDLVDAFNVT